MIKPENAGYKLYFNAPVGQEPVPLEQDGKTAAPKPAAPKVAIKVSVPKQTAKKIPVSAVKTLNLLGASWSLVSSNGGVYKIKFASGGVAEYELPSGKTGTGKWRQGEDNIYFTITDELIECRGKISGARMKGSALSLKGVTWDWTATRK